MTKIALIEQANAIHRRLMNPPNAVPDRGINLRIKPGFQPCKKKPPTPPPAPPPPPKSPEPAIVIYRPLGDLGRYVIAKVAADYGLMPAHLTGGQRLKLIAEARQIVAFILFNKEYATGPRLSSTMIGRILNKDHSTVIHSHKKIGWHILHNTEVGVRAKRLISEIFP